MPRTIFAQRTANPAKPKIDMRRKLIGGEENQTVDYVIVISTLLMVGLYAVLVGWLLPKH